MWMPEESCGACAANEESENVRPVPMHARNKIESVDRITMLGRIGMRARMGVRGTFILDFIWINLILTCLPVLMIRTDKVLENAPGWERAT